MGLFGFSKKKKLDFFKLLNLQMQRTFDGVKLLDHYFKKNEEDVVDNLCKLEHEADEYRRFIVDDLNQTFITPIDRKDIYALSRSIDDIMDLAKIIVEEIEVLEVRPNQYMQMISTNLVHATSKLNDSINHLKERPNLSREAAIRSNLLLNNLQHLYFEAIKDLSELDTDISYRFKLREVFHRLLELAKQIKLTNNILLDIMIKTY
ncbi:DUF47 domain-containing protein [Desulfothermus sp.]